jgi:hypothetical protein
VAAASPPLVVPARRADQTPAPIVAGHAAAVDGAPIQVTIGRVEVRAPAAQAPPQPPAAGAPALSLDEYLRTRGGIR